VEIAVKMALRKFAVDQKLRGDGAEGPTPKLQVARVYDAEYFTSTVLMYQIPIQSTVLKY
jgi:hypothetical protein